MHGATTAQAITADCKGYTRVVTQLPFVDKVRACMYVED